MAEGHAVVRWARRLRTLCGQPLTEVKLPKRWALWSSSIPGQHVAAADTHGKHLLIELSGGWTIHCHAMMYGSWQFGRPGMKLRKAEKQVRLRLRTATREAVFFNGPVVEVLDKEERAAHPRLSALGPDVMRDDFDPIEAHRRLGATGDRELGDAILDQFVVAGVGNIYKSESLFIVGLNPLRAADSVEPAEADGLWTTLHGIMWRDARRSGPIVTLDPQLSRDGQRHWVYRRRGKPCYRCGSDISMVRQGELARATYYCDGCQT